MMFQGIRRLCKREEARDRLLERILTEVLRMSTDFSKLQATVAALQTDQTKMAADVAAILDKLSGIMPNPDDQATVDQITGQLQAMQMALESSAASMDAVLNPPAQPTGGAPVDTGSGQGSGPVEGQTSP